VVRENRNHFRPSGSRLSSAPLAGHFRPSQLSSLLADEKRRGRGNFPRLLRTSARSLSPMAGENPLPDSPGIFRSPLPGDDGRVPRM
jgi:hypothetical protein